MSSRRSWLLIAIVVGAGCGSDERLRAPSAQLPVIEVSGLEPAVANHGAALIVMHDGQRSTVQTATVTPLENAPF